MSKIAVVCDTHWGIKSNSTICHNYFRKFYRDVFFPYIDRHEIKKVIHLGDLGHHHKHINFMTAKAQRTDFMQPIFDRGMDFDLLVGNHDVSLKDSNSINMPQELYGSSPVKIYTGPTEIKVDGTPILLLPWICTENFNETMEKIKKTRAKIFMGHLDLMGFEMNKGTTQTHGMDAKIFSDFDVGFSGHFHHKSNRGNIHYLGAACEHTWSDYDDPRGFHIFDTDTRELTFIRNPYRMYRKAFYNDRDSTIEDVVHNVDYSEFKDSIVKVVIQTKDNPFWFDSFMARLEKDGGVYDIQIVDSHMHRDEAVDEEIDEDGDTVEIFKKYISSLEMEDETKDRVESLVIQLYEEALTLDEI